MRNVRAAINLLRDLVYRLVDSASATKYILHRFRAKVEIYPKILGWMER
ncbi:MAG: hypothetical protein QW795_03335 [Candidatus Bathyarchaeia archaeon]